MTHGWPEGPRNGIMMHRQFGWWGGLSRLFAGAHSRFHFRRQYHLALAKCLATLTNSTCQSLSRYTWGGFTHLIMSPLVLMSDWVGVLSSSGFADRLQTWDWSLKYYGNFTQLYWASSRTLQQDLQECRPIHKGASEPWLRLDTYTTVPKHLLRESP